MAAPATNQEFLELIRKSGVLLDPKRLDAYVEKLRSTNSLPEEPAKLAGLLVRDGLLTHFQAEQLLQGKWRRFTLGKYKVLEKLGSGGMGQVYLCEHKLMRRRVAVKVLPTAKAADQSALQRFYREARAAAALDHPNIVHAYDIDQDEALHFLVMEYVDGASLQEIVKRTGPLAPLRAAHYIRQAALGLEHAHRAGLVHRDIKPGNLLLDRGGTLKVLDMGLARFFNDEDDILTRKYEENVLGTADYLAPEQALDSHTVDIRADIYSLGATLYFCLTGRTPFGEGTVAQKLIWHQTRQPRPIGTFRQDVPAGLVAVLEKMMAKDADQRYQTPAEVAEALAPWTQGEVAPPPEKEMPRLSPAATGAVPAGEATVVSTPPAGPSSPAPRKTWHVATAGGGHQAVTRPAASALPAASTVSRAAPTPSPAPAAAVPRVVPAEAPAEVPTAAELDSANGAAAAEAAVDEPAPWETLGADSGGLAAQVDTPPASPLAPSSRRLGRGRQAARAQERHRLRWVLVGVGGLFLVGLIVVLVQYLLEKPPPPGPPPQRKPLLVSRQPGHAGSFATIQAAFLKARQGDVIELLDERYEEPLEVAPSAGKVTAVTLRAAEGRSVIWTVPKEEKRRPILLLSSASGFSLKGQGITLDGQDRLAHLILLTGDCQGLTLDGLQLRGFTQTAIRVVNCGGTQDRPVRLVGIKSTSTPREKPAAGIYFDAKANIQPSVNEFIEIGDTCEFTGLTDPFQRREEGVIGAGVRLPKGLSW
jgi:serine/threonine protein kinase